MAGVSTEDNMRNIVSLPINEEMKLEFSSYWNYYAHRNRREKVLLKNSLKTLILFIIKHKKTS